MKTRKMLSALLVCCMLILLAVPAHAATTNVKLVDMHTLESDNIKVETEEITDSYGKTYSGNVMRFNSGDNGYVIFDLNGAYSTFNASIVCSTRTGSGAEMSVGIFADGVLVYSLSSYTRQQPAQEVNLDVSGVGELAIKTTKTEGYDGYIYFVNSTFAKAESKSIYPKRGTLSDAFIIDSSACSTSNRLFVDVFGNVHNEYTRLNCGDKGYILYNLDKKYESFSGCIVAAGRTGKEASMNINFYLDDVLVYSQENVTKQTAQINFDFSVANASVLKITTSKNEGYDAYIYVTDGLLKAHEHTPGEWVVETEATCTVDGKTVTHCTACGEVVEQKAIPKTGHTADGKWVVEKEPTCSEKGKQVQKCSVCGEVATSESIDMLEHTPSNDWEITKEATCKAEGKQVKKCTACGKVVTQEAIPTTEHAFGEWETISGSVWNNPIVKERTCSICGDVEHEESNSTSWLKPLVIVLLIIVIGGIAVICVTLKMNSLPLEINSIKKLFSKETLSDTDIDDILNKPDAPTGKSSDQTEK